MVKNKLEKCLKGKCDCVAIKFQNKNKKISQPIQLWIRELNCFQQLKSPNKQISYKQLFNSSKPDRLAIEPNTKQILKLYKAKLLTKRVLEIRSLMLPLTVQAKLITIVILALMNFLLLRRKRNQPDIVESYSVKGDLNYNIKSYEKKEGNEFHLKRQQSNNQEGKLINEKNLKDLFKISEKKIVDHDHEHEQMYFVNVPQSQKTQKVIKSSGLDLSLKNVFSKVKSEILNNSIQLNLQPVEEKQQVSSEHEEKGNHNQVTSKQKHQLTEKSQQNPANQQGKAAQIDKQQVQLVYKMQAQQQEEEQSFKDIPVHLPQSYESLSQKPIRPKSKQKRPKKPSHFSQKEFLQHDDQSSQQPDDFSLSDEMTKKNDKNRISKQTRKPSHKESFKRCLKEIIYEAFEEMMEDDVFEEKIGKKKKKKSL